MEIFKKVIEWRVHQIFVFFLVFLMWSKFYNIHFNSITYLVAISITCLHASVFIYDKIAKGKEDEINCPKITQNALKNSKKIIYFVSFLIILSITILVLLKVFLVLLIYFVIAIIGFLYTKGVIIKHKRYRLKNHHLLKNFAAAGCFSLAASILPGILAKSDFLIVPFFILFFSAYMVEVLWDIRDIVGDREASLQTFPVIYGIPKSKMIISFVGVVGVCLVFFNLNNIFMVFYSLSFISLIVNTLFIFERNPKFNSHFIFFVQMIFILTYLILG